MRQTISLAGQWQFQLDPAGTLTPAALAPDREIPVPLPWQAAFPDLWEYGGYAWYRRTFDLDDAWLRGDLLLHFGAVDYWCQVFVNGRLAGAHEGGYTPFTLPIRAYAQAGRNEIVVRVYDSPQTGMPIPRWPAYPPDAGSGGPPFDPNNIPHGKQEWYINVGGIWQDVTVTAVPRTYIDHVRVIPDIHTGQARLTVTLGGVSETNDGRIRANILNESASFAEISVPINTQEQIYEVGIKVEQPRLWDLADPYLYTARIQLHTADGADELDVRFGYREIATRDGRLLLNGAPLFLLSALDQDFYPDTIYTVPSEEYLRDQFQKAKDLGLNCLRCHIKPADPRYLDLADEMGLLIWAEIPSWRTFYPKGTVHENELNLAPDVQARVEQTLVEMIRRDCNHPAIVIWTIVNEDWGTALPLSAADRAWVAQMYRRCKDLDPTRLVVDNSACPHPWGPNFHVHSDLDDFHVYANIPDHARGFEQTVEQLALRPLWTYSNFGDATRTGQEPLILSEFGNWGLPSLDILRRHYGGDPPWFKLGPWWSPWDGEAGWAFGTDERFRRLGLDQIWRDYEHFVQCTQWHQFNAMKLEIEAMRRQQALSGYVITEFTDCYWEANGLLDMTRQPKAYHDQFGWVNATDVIVPQVPRYAYWDDQTVTVVFHGAHYSPAEWAGARLVWSIDGAPADDSVPVAGIGRGVARALGSLAFRFPPVAETRTVRFEFTVEGAGGGVLARNSLDLLVLPAESRRPTYADLVSVVITEDRPVVTTLGAVSPQTASAEPEGALPDSISDEDPGSHLEHMVRNLGYRTTRRLTTQTRVAVTNYPTARLLQWVRDGGDLLYLAAGTSPFFWFQGRGGAYSGSWITSFSWLRPGIYRRVQADNPLTLPFLGVMPGATILGLPVEEPALHGDYLAGMVSGWVRHPSVHTVQFRYGRGRVIMTTFGIEHGWPDHPLATALFHDLLEYLVSDACRPQLAANY